MYHRVLFSNSGAHTDFRCDYLENCIMNLVEKYGFKAEMLHSVLDHLYSEK